MASAEAADAAVAELPDRLHGVPEQTRAKIPDRTVSLLLTDLDRGYGARLVGGELVDLTRLPDTRADPADVRLTMTSDSLLDLLTGQLSFVRGWAAGKIRVSASLANVLELRRFL
ncbi:MAG TPA: hypothetical protein VFN19_07265 [Candidatus Nanopelagicales bacterium]|jgi:putative sterol carrier protein|nr:hypothetical protein [Candidatus Nanopelagicales bacterium]